MSECLLHLAADFRVDNILVPWEELISSETLLNELAHALSRSGWPSRTFEEIRIKLLRLANNFKIDNRIVQWDELISSDTILNELGHALSRCGCPARTFEEIRKELLRLHGRRKKIHHKSESHMRFAAKHIFFMDC